MPPRPRDYRVFMALLIAGGGFDFAWRLLAQVGLNQLATLVAVASMSVPLIAVGCLVCAAAPRLARATAIGGLMALFSLSLLSCWIVQARELARQQKCVDNLRQMGIVAREQMSLHQGSDPYRQPR